MAQIEILDCFDRRAVEGTAGDGAGRGEPTLSAADIVARTRLPRSSVFRDLKLLISSGFIFQDTVSKRYALGPRVLQLGMAARRQLSSEGLVVVPLIDLVRETGESVTFSLVDLPWRVCVYVIEAPSELRQFAQVGTRYPLHLGAAGKAILAFLPSDTVAAVLKSHSVTRSQSTEITGQLVQIRKRGYSVTAGERVAGASSAAAPVFVGSSVYGSVAVAGPTDRFKTTIERHQRMVVETARRLSERLSSRASHEAVGATKRVTAQTRR